MLARTRNPSANDLLDKPSRLLIEAIAGRQSRAVAALKEWRATVTLDDASYVSHRILPILADLIREQGLHDPDLARMRGVSRRYWVNNVLKFRLLFSALDVLEGAGVETMLLKGAALFARRPGTEGKRRSADYDFMVRPEDLARAGEILETRGFLPWGHSWRDLREKVFDASGEGIAIVLRGYVGEIDLHWRPVWNIQDPSLAARFFSAAEDRNLRGRFVRVPSVTHHLFSAIARCEPWDREECFARLVEGCILLSEDVGTVNWQELATILLEYGMVAPAVAYCDAISRHTSIRMPQGFVDCLKSRLTESNRYEWRIRGVASEDRSESEQQFLNRQDAKFRRVVPQFPLPGRIETWLRGLNNPRPVLQPLWRLARQRFSGPSSLYPRFLEGFSYPEASGRWTLGRWAVMTVPLTKAQRKGEAVRFHLRVYRGARPETRVVLTGGLDPVTRVLARDQVGLVISLTMLPVPELGGDGLALLWLPDACSPWRCGESGDRRNLGLFVSKDWRGPAHDPEDARFFRIARRVRRPGLVEIGLRHLGFLAPAFRLAWHMSRRRFSGRASASPRFLEGFDLSEPRGRRTVGQWALMTVPLTKAQRRGKPVRFNTQVLLGAAAKVRVCATGGCEVVGCLLTSDGPNPSLRFSVRPLRAIGGNGLVLFWLSGAITRRGSDSRERPSLLICKEWQTR